MTTMYYPQIFAQTYGGGTYNGSTYSGSATTGAGSGTGNGSGLSNTGIAIVSIVTIAAVVLLIAVVLRVWRRPGRQAAPEIVQSEDQTEAAGAETGSSEDANR